MAGLRKPSGGPSPSPRPRDDRDSAEHESAAQEDLQASAPEEPAASTANTEVHDTGTPEAADTTGATDTGTTDTGAEVDALTGEPEADRQRPKPSPRRKSRDSGVLKPSSETEIDTEQAAGTEHEPARTGGAATGVAGTSRRAGSRLSRKPLIAGLLVIAVLFAGLAVFFRIQGAEAQSATNNTALVDVARTAQVKEEVSAAVEQLFSYDYNDIEKTENAAKDLLVTDEVRKKYEQTFAEVKRVAPEQKMVLTTKVTRSAVIMLDDDRARLLLFVDQTSTRTDQNQTSAGGSQLSVNAELRDGSWKITDMNTYNDLSAPAPAGEGGKAPDGN